MKLFRTIALALAVVLMAPSLSAKKEKAEDKNVDLGEWVRQQAEALPAEVDGVRIFRPSTQNGKAVVSDMLDLAGVSPRQAFVAALIFAREHLDPEFEAMGKIDYDNCRFIVNLSPVSGEGKDQASFSYEQAFLFADDIMSFQASDIVFGYKEKGILPRKLEAEKLKPATNSRHKELVEAFSLLNSRYLADMLAYIKANPQIKVTHWEDIGKGVVTKGMTPHEVTLIAGKPANINNSGNREKWLYSNDFIVVFTAGVVSTVIQ